MLIDWIVETPITEGDTTAIPAMATVQVWVWVAWSVCLYIDSTRRQLIHLAAQGMGLGAGMLGTSAKLSLPLRTIQATDLLPSIGGALLGGLLF